MLHFSHIKHLFNRCLLAGVLMTSSYVTQAEQPPTSAADSTPEGKPILVGLLPRTLNVSQKETVALSLEAEVPLMALREQGFTPITQYLSYPRVVRSLQQGSIGAGSILRYNDKWMTPDTANFSCHEQPYIRLPLYVYKRSDDSRMGDSLTSEELESFSVGYMRSVAKDVDPFIDRPNFVPASAMHTLFKMLKNKRLDTVFADVAIAESLSRQLSIDIQPVMQLGKLESFLCFSNKRFGETEAKALAIDYYQQLKKLHHSGSIRHFLKSHQLEFYRDLYLPN